MNQKIKVLLIAGNIWYFGEGMFGPLLAIFAERIGGSILDISWAWAIYLIVSGTMVIAVGTFADKFNKAKILLSAYALNAVLTFCYLLVQTPFQLFIVQAGLGVAAALAIPTWDALYDISQNDQNKNAYIWGMASGQFQIVTGIAIIVGGLIVSNFSFEALFLTMGIIQVIGTIYQAKVLKLL